MISAAIERSAGIDRRKQLLGAGTSERNRVQKVLEDANVKLGNHNAQRMRGDSARRNSGKPSG